MNHLISENDQKILARYQANVAKHLAASKAAGHERQTTEEYRAMMLSLNPFKFPPNYKNLAPVASYRPKLQLKPGLTAAVAVPKGKGPFPIIVHAHGHGLQAGSPPEYEPWMRVMASYGFVVVFPDYRWQPEASFQDQIDDMMYAVDWVRKNPAQINGDPSKLILGGDSAGGSLCLATLLDTLKNPSGPRFLAVEVVDGAINPQSGRDLLAEITPALPIPPVIWSVGSADQTMPSGLAVATALRKAGKQFELRIYYGLPHDALKLPELEIMHKGNDDAMKWLQKVV